MGRYNFPIMLMAVRDYGMDETEGAAFRMLIDYLELKSKYFPGYLLEQVSTAKDPRKSHYFRMCYKAVTETSNWGLAKENRRLYVKAQLQILKIIEGDYPITVECLAGPKAWKRWLLWWHHYQKRTQAVEEVALNADVAAKIRAEIHTSSQFLQNRKTDLGRAGDNLSRWVKVGAVSPYHIAAHPDGERLAAQIGLDISEHKKQVRSLGITAL